MGQKVNPHGLRVGVISDWDSNWFAEDKFADYPRASIDAFDFFCRNLVILPSLIE